MAQKQSIPSTKEVSKNNSGAAVLRLSTNVKAGAYVGLVVTSGWGSGQPGS